MPSIPPEHSGATPDSAKLTSPKAADTAHKTVKIRHYVARLMLLYTFLVLGLAFGYRFFYELPREVALLEGIQLREVASVDNALKFSLTRIELVLEDWAYWDDSYAFVQAPQQFPNYIPTNITTGTFDDLGLIGIQYLNAEFQVVFEQGYDPRSQSLLPFSSLDIDVIARLRSMDSTEDDDGFLLHSEWITSALGPAHMAVSTISTSNADRAPVGYLVFIKLFTQEDLSELTEMTRLPLAMLALEHEPEEWLPLSAGVLEAGIDRQRTRALLDQHTGLPVMGIQIEHEFSQVPPMLSVGTVMLMLGLLAVPLVILWIVELRLVRPLEHNAARIKRMVEAKQLSELAHKFPLNELEDIRLAFNRAVVLGQEQQARLQDLSNTDGLTGLANRRALDEVADIMFRQAKRHQQTMLWMILDLDHFKEFNDTQGHLAGDDALRQVGNVLRELTHRATEFAARSGGEEFVLIINGMSEAEAEQRADAIRVAIEAMDIKHPASSVAPVLTVSIGALWLADASSVAPADNVDRLLDVADQALYRAKRQGRNRVVVTTYNGEA